MALFRRGLHLLGQQTCRHQFTTTQANLTSLTGAVSVVASNRGSLLGRSLATVSNDDDESDMGELIWPIPPEALRNATPLLRHAILAHEGFLKTTLKQRLQRRISEHMPTLKYAASVSRITLNKLKVDELREELEQAGENALGSRDQLVDRLLMMLDADEATQTANNEGNAAAETTNTNDMTAQSSKGEIAETGNTKVKQGNTKVPTAQAGVGASSEGSFVRPSSPVSAPKDRNKAASSPPPVPMSPREQKFGKVIIPKPVKPPRVSSDLDVVAQKMELQEKVARVFTPEEVGKILLDVRAEDISCIDVRGRCSYTEHMMLATAKSLRHVHAVASAALYELKNRCHEVAPGVKPGVEGDTASDWVILDAGSVVLHVFTEEARERFDLDSLWGRPGLVTKVNPERKVETLRTIKVEEEE